MRSRYISQARPLRQKDYKVDLQGLQSLCGLNYAKLGKLMPEADSRDCWAYGISPGAKQRIVIRVVDRAPYTTTVIIEQSDAINPVLKPMSLDVRIYHDAAMAEVVRGKDYRQFSGRYPYPNRDMHQADEKAQLNQFLSDWLGLCLEQGHTLDKMNFPSVGEQL
ncbi:MAG: DUF1249 domain-containing protein [Cellvibrionaceae bacterium]|nr:DUF1249 domain-containing protein [Cellvibrionaceae bacterium]